MGPEEAWLWLGVGRGGVQEQGSGLQNAEDILPISQFFLSQSFALRPF